MYSLRRLSFANYRGCTIAKEIRLIRIKNRIKPAVVRHHSTRTVKPSGTAEKPIVNATGHIRTKSVSYAQAVAKSLIKPAQEHLKTIPKSWITF